MGLILLTSFLIFLRVISFIVLVDVILSYFMNPFNPVRAFLDKLVEPLLGPIRKIVPPIGGLDFSPLVLIIVLQILESLISNL
jgi:YggT family protein